ncbi:MAG: hypothetical protein ACRDMV_23505 [Streptosporangiales bacterium]
MATSDTTRRFTPAPRLLASIMGIVLLILGAFGLAWHLVFGLLPEWILGENIGLDIFHLAMGVLALLVLPARVTIKAYGLLALVVFGFGTIITAVSVELESEGIYGHGMPYWFTHNSLGFSETNYIVYALMAIWGFLLVKTAMEVDPWGSGDSHETLRSMPDREHVIEDERRELTR